MMLLSLIAIPLFAQESQKHQLSLQQATDMALENNWNYKNATLEVQKAEKKVWETTAMGLPQLNGEVSYQHFLDIPTQVVPGGAFSMGDDFNNFLGQLAMATGVTPPAAEEPAAFDALQFGMDNNFSAGLTATQLIFDGSYIIGLRAAKSYVKMSENQLKKTEIDVREGVAQSYYLVLAAKENKRILEENLISANDLLRGAKEMHKEGLIEIMEVEQLELQVASLNASIDHANASLRTAKLLLNFNLGLSPEDEVTVTNRLDDFIKLNSASTAEGKVNVLAHIDYLTIENKERLDYLNWKNEQVRSLPSLAAFYNYSQNAFGNEFDFSDTQDADGNTNFFPTQVVGVKMTVPLFTSFRGTARMKQAKLTLEQTRNQKSMVENSLKLHFETAKADYINALKQYENSKDSEALAKKIYDRTSIKYGEGLSTSFELNQAKAQLLQAQGAYINNIVNVLNAKTKLDKANSNL